MKAPPLWMRHLISWRLLSFINRHTTTCWAEMCMWKAGSEIESWSVRSMCWGGPEGGYDYCNRWETLKAFTAATGLPPYEEAKP